MKASGKFLKMTVALLLSVCLTIGGYTCEAATASKTMTVGSSINLIVKQAAKWSTSNKKVASLTKITNLKYKVTALSKGTAKISAKVGKVAYSFRINVKAASSSESSSASSVSQYTDSVQARAIAGSADSSFTVKTKSGTTEIVGHYDEAMAGNILAQLNSYRASKGLKTLSRDAHLVTAAKVRAYEAGVSFSHTRPDGTSCFTVSSYSYGENLAYGFSTADSVMNAWKNSPTHNANMVKDGFSTVGIAVFCAKQADGSYVYYSVQQFGK